jgi:hypothetical protein
LSDAISIVGTEHDWRWHFDSDSPAIGRDQEADACDGQECAVDGPFGLASHEAPGKDVDSLKNPDASHEEA